MKRKSTAFWAKTRVHSLHELSYTVRWTNVRVKELLHFVNRTASRQCLKLPNWKMRDFKPNDLSISHQCWLIWKLFRSISHWLFQRFWASNWCLGILKIIFLLKLIFMCNISVNYVSSGWSNYLMPLYKTVSLWRTLIMN